MCFDLNQLRKNLLMGEFNIFTNLCIMILVFEVMMLYY